MKCSVTCQDIFVGYKFGATMKLNERPAATTKLVGGRLCLDFVNAVGGRRPDAPTKKELAEARLVREDRLNDYGDLLAWSQHVGLLTEGEARKLFRESRQRQAEAASVFARAIALREAIYRIFKALLNKSLPRQSDLERLNQELTMAYGRVRLAAGEENFVWEWTDVKNSLDRMLWLIADSAAEFLTTGDLTRLRECSGEDCGWLFEDTSKNRSRQWCDMRDCGNLAKVRRFRTRLHANAP
jgi:predicted RNA-binding Zn ribbon-like protein